MDAYLRFGKVSKIWWGKFPLHTRKRKRKKGIDYVSVKVVLISTRVLSMAMGLKFTLPFLSHFFLTEAPYVWTFFLTCFTPPYLYILINFIILTILFQALQLSPPPLPARRHRIYDRPPTAVQIHVPDTVNITVAAQTDYEVDVVASDKYLDETKLTPSYDTVTKGNGSISFIYNENTPVKATVNNDDSVGVRKNSSEFVFAYENEKPPVSAKFSHWCTGRQNDRNPNHVEGEGCGIGSGEGEEARDTVEHVEDDNRGASYAVNSTFEEGEDVGDAGDAVEGFERRGDDEEVGDVRREGEERVYKAEEGAIAESGRVEPTSGSLHQQAEMRLQR
ncbi:hypothetical protein CR513_22753, partial [Mucuna pruriens]